MKVKVSEASGPVLDWMVAKCEEANIGEGYYTGIVLRDGEVEYAGLGEEVEVPDELA